MSGYEPVLHALSVEPRAARPGQTVRLVFRTRNLSALPSPAATVRFAPSEGLEPLDPLAVAVAPVAPGAELVATLRARVAAGLDDRSELAVEAALELAGGPLGTNLCRLAVRSRPRLDGPATGVAVSALDGEIVRVHATVVNEGDGPAHGLRVVVPVPLGCVALEGEAATQLGLDRLGVGERASLAYDARIVAPLAAVRPEGYVLAADGARCALPARGALALAPVLAAPRVALVPSRRRVDLTVELRNDGWVDARDVRVRVALPAPLRALAESLVVDGVPLAGVAFDGLRFSSAAFDGVANGFARVERAGEVQREDAEHDDTEHGDAEHDHAKRGDAEHGDAVCDGEALAIVIGRVPARGSVRVGLAAQVPPGCAGGTIGVAVGAHRVAVPFAAVAVREVRLRVVTAPPVIEPGAELRLVAELANAGDVPERLTLTAGGAHFSADAAEAVELPVAELAPGAVVPVELVLRVDDGVADDARLGLALVARDALGERARCEVELVARERAWLVLDELPVRADGRVAYALRNAGTTTARAVVALAGDETHALDPLAPGASTTLTVSGRAARRGGLVRVAGRDALVLPPLDERPPAAVRALLAAPASAVAGAPFAVRAEIEVDDAVEVLALRVPALAGAAYVPGSTALDGRALLDRSHESPLAGPGLVLRGVPAATRIRLSWSLLAGAAPAGDALALAAQLEVDGEPREVAAVRVEVQARAAFAARPAGLPYHVDACTLAPDGALVLLPHLASEPIAESTLELMECEPAQSESVQSEPVECDRLEIQSMEPQPVQRAVEHEPVQLVPLQRAPVAFEPLQTTPIEPAEAFTFVLRLDGERLDEIARLLCGAERSGLVAHALALRAFFPDAAMSAGVPLAEALRSARHALRDVFDRLFVKVRIPGFDVSAADLEDPALRRALVRLYERLLDATSTGVAPIDIALDGAMPADVGLTGVSSADTMRDGPAPGLVSPDDMPGLASGRLEHSRVRSVLASFADAPFGAPAMLRALVALVPTRCADEPLLAAALARYARALDDALARCETAPADVFDDALARGGDRALDDARAGLLAALRTRVALAA